jgi:hypothetical protein
MSAWVDHLAVAASSLDASTLERVLGVPLAGGGKHDRMGTHNRLLRLGNLLGLAFRCAPASLPRITARFRTPAGQRTLLSSEPIR